MLDSREVKAPYPGLRPFEPHEGEIFFGREAHTDRLLEILQRECFLAVLGPSGAGKSSLVRAGLLPGLAAGWLGGASDWRIAVLRPGERPFRRLAEELAQSGALGANAEASLPGIEAELRRGPLGLVHLVADARRGETSSRPFKLLVLIDQFEEIFRYAQAGGTEADESEAFVNLLLASRAEPEAGVYVALTMRTDFLGHCMRFLELPEAINRAQYLIPRLTRTELERAITGPALVFGGDVAPELVTELINSLDQDFDQLPLLQHALAWMWIIESVKSGASPLLLTVAGLEALGGLQGALSAHAEEVLGKLSVGEQALAETLFRCITLRERTGPDAHSVRRPQRLEQIAAVADCDWRELEPVVRSFAAESVNLLHYGEPLAPQSVIDLSHEALIRHWERLRTWADDEAERTAELLRWRDRAVLRKQGGELLKGADLARAIAWLADEAGRLPKLRWVAQYSDFEGALGFRDTLAFIAESKAADTERREQENLQGKAQGQLERGAFEALTEADWGGAPVSRLSYTLDGSIKNHLPENAFWLQAQGILASTIVQGEYDHQLYLDVRISSTHAQSDEIQHYLDSSLEQRCLLLVGAPGVGKSSLLQHYRHVKVAPSAEAWAWVHFDGNVHFARLAADGIAELIPCFLAVSVQSLFSFLQRHHMTRMDFFLDVLEHDIGLATERFLASGASMDEKIEIAKNYLERNQRVFLEATLRFFSRSVSPGKAVLVLDNLDPLGPEIQAEAVRQAVGLAASSEIKSIVSIRKKAAASLFFNDRDLAFQCLRTTVQHPPLVEVLRRRVAIALQHHEAQNAKLGEGALQFKIRDCPEFADLLVRGLEAEGLQRIIEGISDGSVRRALQISLTIYRSPYLDSKLIFSKLSPAGAVVGGGWRDSIPNHISHIAVRSILLGTAKIYDEAIASVSNIFGSTASNTHLGPFLRLHILRFLQAPNSEDMPEDECARELAPILRIGGDLIKEEIKWLARNEWVEIAPPRTISLTRLGDFVAREFVFHRDYLSCISTDVDMYSDFERRLLPMPGNFGERMHNAVVLIEYLALRELQMIRLFSKSGDLRVYCKWFGQNSFTSEILERVLSRAKYLRSDIVLDSVRTEFEKLSHGTVLRELRELVGRFDK